MNFLILGDICGASGMNAIKKNLKSIIKKKNIDFTIANGENAADNGKGITQKNLKDLLNSGVDVVTSGNHIWDQKEISDVIDKEKRLIRPENLIEGQPGNGYGVFEFKEKNCCNKFNWKCFYEEKSKCILSN